MRLQSSFLINLSSQKERSRYSLSLSLVETYSIQFQRLENFTSPIQNPGSRAVLRILGALGTNPNRKRIPNFRLQLSVLEYCIASCMCVILVNAGLLI